MAFTPQFLDEIRTRLPCSEVIGRRVRLIKKGREHSGLCPFHNEKSPSFTVNDDKGFFHCFGCGAHGDVIGFSMRIDNLSFPETVEKLAGEAGLELPKYTPQERERAQRQQTLHEAVEAACVWFQKQLQSPAGKAGQDYLRGRGLSAETIARFRLGYAPGGGYGGETPSQNQGRNALKSALVAAGLKEPLLLEAGLLVKPDDGRDSFDFFRGRVIFPIMDRRGRVIAFGGRILGDGQPKYLNSRDTPLFDKGRTLYALDKARAGVAGGAGRTPAELVVAEGYMDVIALHEAGFAGAVAPLGTALTEGQLDLLWKLAPEPILCLDGDAAGQRAALRAAERALPLLKPGTSLRFATLPPSEDPDSLIRKRGATAFAELLARARPLIDVVWESETAGRPIDTPERRAGLERRLKERLAVIADRTVQQQYFSMLLRDRLWNAFRPARTGRRGNPPGTAAPLRYSGLASPREAEILLATLVNHPELVPEQCETLASLDLDSPELDKILKEILYLAGRGELDSAALKSHLMATGMAATLTGLLQLSLYKLWAFSGPAADLPAARTGLEHLMARFHERRLEIEVSAAQQEFSTGGSVEGEALLSRLQEELRNSGVRGTVPDDEDASETPTGRPQPTVSNGN